ncbi:hypothetical protein R69608_03295 [Paraburkholderia nemoris]|nr:hypothetical protein R69608_03295 [Paraburkholderia nemoris]
MRQRKMRPPNTSITLVNGLLDVSILLAPKNKGRTTQCALRLPAIAVLHQPPTKHITR